MVIISFWLTLLLCTLLAELYNPGLFYFLSLACGAGAAAISCLTLQSIDLQLAWFAAIAALAWVILKRIAHSKRIAPYHATNMAALVGKKAVIVESATASGKGYVKIAGDFWPVMTQDGSLMQQGMDVEIIAVVGNHLIVKPI